MKKRKGKEGNIEAKPPCSTHNKYLNLNTMKQCHKTAARKDLKLKVTAQEK